ncbi:hypothetical protein C3747_2g243 [Trypanosoma cruzi]|uniref:Uncharacterized protein n=2 Tax=Trypanosoma cruzi TaxID=5693 RepID=Q4D255_TRYCC|nr:hypothetical protein, conserved [Trypanosoma cruzi]EAN86609.1 hypothetical protein, conserved [Trypanosoma cruzi]PWV21652.1 hypothetical protein C3747_2g243 [Trypanosoma cruzi]RNC61629.1 hypothetical protein TcCL_ESM00708 [Trypanosoma cruzi]|eukprot:XP_808460.1 hypothetical protein [Trypanosoma cruzi strain CL Brener]
MRRPLGCGPRLLLAFGCLFVLAFAVTQVNALTVGCEKVWSGPSSTNSVKACLSNRNRIEDYWRYYIYPGFAALFFVLLLIIFPICFCICACNGTCCRTCCFPTSAAQHYNGPSCLYLAAVIAILWGAGSMVAIIMGAHTMHTGVQDAVYNAKHTTAPYFKNIAKQVEQYTMVDGVILPIIEKETQVVVDIYDTVMRNIDDFDRKYLKYLDDAAIVSYSLGWMPFVLLLFALFFGLCRISRCLPACFSCVYYFVGLVFALLSVIFLVAAYFGSALNGELDRQLARQPGILQWYVVPYFESHFNAQVMQLDTSIEGLISLHVADACTEINEYCDNNPVFSDQKPFFCTSAVKCETFYELLEQVSTVPVKNPNFCTPAPDASPSDASCTIALCATNCFDRAGVPDVSAARTASVDVMKNLQVSKNATIARNLVNPLMDPDMIADILLLSTGPFTELSEGFWMAGTGYFISILVFALGIYTMLRGRVVWGEYVDRKKAH